MSNEMSRTQNTNAENSKGGQIEKDPGKAQIQIQVKVKPRRMKPENAAARTGRRILPWISARGVLEDLFRSMAAVQCCMH